MEVIQEISTTFAMSEAEIKQSVLAGKYDEASSTYFLLSHHKEAMKRSRRSPSNSPRRADTHGARSSRASEKSERNSSSRGSRDSPSTDSNSPRTNEKKEEPTLPPPPITLSSTTTPVRAPPFKEGKFKPPAHRRARTEGESISQRTKVTSDMPTISIESPKKRTGPIRLEVGERSPVKRPMDITPLALTDPVKLPKGQMSPRQSTSLNSDPQTPPKRSGAEDIIIPFEISPPKQMKRNLTNSPRENEVKDLARSWRLTFGELQDHTRSASDDSNEETRIKPRELRIPVHHRTITTDSPDAILTKIKSCLADNGFTNQWNTHYCLVCAKHNLTFELEICSLPNLDINGIKFSRISGDIWLYKKICKKILKKLKSAQRESWKA